MDNSRDKIWFKKSTRIECNIEDVNSSFKILVSTINNFLVCTLV